MQHEYDLNYDIQCERHRDAQRRATHHHLVKIAEQGNREDRALLIRFVMAWLGQLLMYCGKHLLERSGRWETSRRVFDS